MAVSAMKRDVSAFKRSLVLAAAARLFSERGFAATTVDAIADDLSASKRAIYDHFAGKTEILIAICEQAVQFSAELAERVARMPGSPATKLQAMARDFTHIVVANRHTIAISTREMHFLPEESRRRITRMQKRFDRVLGAILAEGIACGEFQMADPALTALAISGMIVWVHRWFRAGGRLSAEEVAEAMARTALGMAGHDVQQRSSAAHR